jgi:CHAT domain-containing protein
VAFGEVRFAALPGSGPELETIADLWRRTPRPTSERDAMPPEVLKGVQATETEFRRRAAGRRVVHLATHGFFVGGPCAGPGDDARGIGGMVPRVAPAPQPPAALHPFRISGLALAGANLRSRASPDQDDGILTAEEIAALDLTGVQWAVLSACETGVGDYHPGEGVMGLRRAFLIAGARTTIMSLWPVRDRTAGRWMRTLYESHWLRGLDTAASVRMASLSELRARRAAGRAAHPVHWGAFIAVGDWR